MHITKIESQGIFGVMADILMVPVMFLTQLTLTESLQRTHFWNNKKLSSDEIYRLNELFMVKHSGDPSAVIRWLCGVVPVSHISVLGGWKNFVVIGPLNDDETWFPGWKANDVSGVSQIPIVGPVKLLLGPGSVQYFGLNSCGYQIPIEQFGTGRLGQNGPFRHVPLR